MTVDLFNSVLNSVTMKSILLFAVCGCICSTSFGLPLRESGIDMIEERATGNVRFFLYTRQNRDEPQELFIGDVEGVKRSNFIKSHHTKILVHGWGGKYTSSPNPGCRKAYLDREDYNIISIDWYPYSKLNYVSARNKVPLVGEDVAEFIDFLHDEFELDFNKLVIVGHSLGSHVSGYAGKFVKRGKVAAIVGQDPAFPLYTHENTETRLSVNDAQYVQTIQTNGNMLGFYKPIGHVAFYPNWGRNQAGCGNDLTGSCSHGRSVTYYEEALRGYVFTPMYKCASFEDIQAEDADRCNKHQPDARMGDPLLVNQIEGIYYFETNEVRPYGQLLERSIDQ